MNILLLKGYNNYFNRIMKREDTLAAYRAAVSSYLEYQSVNFNPNDGITTSLVIGGPTQKGTSNTVLAWEHSGSPDYLVAWEDFPVAQGGPVIRHRWFITECERTRNGQYKVSLKRDVLADFFEDVMTSPCFVEKGFIDDVNNPLLLNAEGMVFNKIKNSEDYIKDTSKCAWLVGYVKKDIDNNDLSNVNPINYTAPDVTEGIPDADDFSWEDCIQYYDSKGALVNNDPKKCFYFYNTDVSFRTWYNPNYFSFMTGNVRYTMTENFGVIYVSTDFPNEDWGPLKSCAFDIAGSQSDAMAATITANVFRVTRDDVDVRNKYQTMIAAGKSAQFGANTILVTEDIFKYNGKQIVKDDKVYRLEISTGQSEKITKTMTGNDAAALNWMTSAAAKVNKLSYNSDNAGKAKIRLDFRGKSYQIIAREVILDETISFNFPVSANRNNCTDATYDMFCMPIDPKALGLSVSTDPVVFAYLDGDDDEQVVDISSISETQLTMAIKLCTQLGANSAASLVYDLQLLPYCPFEELNCYFENHIYGPKYGKTVLDATELESNDFTVIFNNEDDPEVRGVIFYPKKANFSKLVDFEVPDVSVHYEDYVLTNPTFKYNNQSYNGLPVFIMHFPYPVTDEHLSMDDVTLPSVISNGLQWSAVGPVFTNDTQPYIVFTNSNMTGPYDPDEKVTFEGTELSMLAHWILPDRPMDVKIKNECDMYRLSSPNFMSMYEFKKTKLRNGILSFNIDCTYKPFTPYIKVNPNYDDSLYAVQDFNDSMGLILGGDFSIPMLSDAWVNYELQNRNYQAIFNRTIENLDVNNQIAKEQQQFQAIMGTITGGIGGATAGGMAGFKAGGPWGAAAGAAIGGVTGITAGAVGGALDAQWLARQQAETRSFAIDQFNYQLGTTQALNPTITKSTPLTYNNKVWPVLEYYTCTDKEKELLEQKIKYDGMTIMAIDTLRAYAVDGYRVKGKLIRLEGIQDDSHVADAIYQEVDKGFYIKGE